MNKDFIDPFVKGIKEVLKKIGNIQVTSNGETYEEKNEIQSKGVTSIISYSGKTNGRFLIDMDPDTAISLTRKINGGRYDTVKEQMVLSTISELNNIIAGDGLTDINNKFSMRLRLGPPVVFAADEALVCLDKIPSESVNISTDCGDIRINIAFERSPEVSG
ncbi:MAG: chemotaxis protein CheX [Deltaproteobacteria bacterium]